MKPKAIILVSGGLDSLLAAAILKEQLSEGYMLHFVNPFSAVRSLEYIKEASERLGFPLIIEPFKDDYIRMVVSPKFGYGKNLNPCIDCRIFQFKKALKIMNKKVADFIVTGEVVGQRPMSQNLRAMRRIDMESGASGRILRPLSASFFPPTIAEKKGLINRDNLLSLSGRSRKNQMALAESLGVRRYETPAGGCLLTIKEYSSKLKDLIESGKILTLNEISLLKVGRHFRISPSCKLIVGRDKSENEIIERIRTPEYLLLRPEERKGPTSILDINPSYDDIWTAARICARYTDRGEDEKIKFIYYNEEVAGNIKSSAFDDNRIEAFRI